ncbi:MAG: metal-dependent transcriptional regulator [Candidatus Omnitrophica bacterium]|nr:metal-dependent transcriptional regulator [Candidatus Omnitrophota bacterium]
MASQKHKLSANMEDYLEVIAMLKDEKGVVRVKDISDRMNVKKPSVTAAMNSLASKGLIEHERYGYIDLSVEGEKLAREVKERHDMLTRFFMDILGVSENSAETDACKIEHSLSKETSEKLMHLVEYLEMHAGERPPQWLKNLNEYIGKNK